MKRRSVHFFVALVSCGSCAAHAQNLRSQCDPNRPTVDKAMALRNAGELEAAERLLKPIADGSRNSFGASYILATIELSRGGNAADDGLNRLVQTERLLPNQSRGCARALGWYSIYNTIGAQYYRRKNLDRSEEYLLRGYNHLDDVFDETKRLLLGNLGLLYFAKGNLDKSISFYQQAQRAGSKDAGNRLAVIERIKRGTPQ